MRQSTAHCSIFTFCLLACCFALVACSDSIGSGHSGATSVPTPAAILDLTPTPSPDPSVRLIMVAGDGYTIGYPAGWTSEENSNNGINTLIVAHADSGISSLDANASSIPCLVVDTVINSTGISTASSVRQVLAGVRGQAKNFQGKNVLATVTINGIVWNQGAATFDDLAIGQNATIYVLSTKFPGNSKLIASIIYIAVTSEFDKDSAEDFLPMLFSFKFT
jgi:hypothetical protein